jgi:hypothetical protein
MGGLSMAIVGVNMLWFRLNLVGLISLMHAQNRRVLKVACLVSVLEHLYLVVPLPPAYTLFHHEEDLIAAQRVFVCGWSRRSFHCDDEL